MSGFVNDIEYGNPGESLLGWAMIAYIVWIVNLEFHWFNKLILVILPLSAVTSCMY